MFPRFEVAGFAITLTIVFLFGARFKSPSFPDFDASGLSGGFGDDALSQNGGSSRFDDVQPPDQFEDVPVADLFFEEDTAEHGEKRSSSNIVDTMNSTLGFAKVFVISMPERSDKRDAFSLQARLSNISFEVRDGVAGADVSLKALPHSFAQDAGATGCWRAHLNVMQEMLRDNIQSAIVFEDDADWDLAIKYQMMQAAQATRFLTAQTEDEKPLSPYGDNWDIIWFGHCAAQTDPQSDRRFVVTDDPTVLPPWARSEFVQPDMSIWEEDSDDYLNFQTRIYFRSSWNSCTAGYAISLRGAEKVVFTESMVPFNDPVDNGMGAMCNRHALDFTCIAPFPTVVGISKPAGASNRGSDIRGLDNVQVIEQGRSERLMYSTRQNIPRILTGQEDFVSVFPEDSVPALTVKDIGRGMGHPEWVWAGTRYFDEEEYLQGRFGQQAQNQEQQVHVDNKAQEDQKSEAEDWTSPIEQEEGGTQKDLEPQETFSSRDHEVETAEFTGDPSEHDPDRKWHEEPEDNTHLSK
ncbi:uncharacterized protein Z519_04597 [Cladophialophora bantiana CBS 173.52]|uniref:Glycosyl transferase family 25 domain-containing protein n=1 Tax=Cladophialophora bantiana (strain ATCC 10958 / CBS 173.52 / CDC B-1940 / NIH 8579) TaxID=1442370 RepID=A0A0D2EXH0_CLAB1|nr:uncharacterized protein Z519_04597 [Cladophialophora bantiana CBS 173.52]KIW94621.1 hypothetical protein Z519_04597 [Cladophialophora bantiana CBS 173.52]